MPEVNEAVIATYLMGGNTRRIRGALQPLLKAAPLSKSAVSRVVATLKDGLEAWRTRSLTDLDVIYVSLDAFALRVRSAGKVVSVPVLGVVGVLTDGRKRLLALELCSGESFGAWKGCLDDLVARGLRAPVLAIIDGNPGLGRAVSEMWPRAAVQRCCVHKLRNLERKSPKHALAEIRDDFHRIAYAASAEAARSAYVRFECVWAKRRPGVVASLREGGDEPAHVLHLPQGAVEHAPDHQHDRATLRGVSTAGQNARLPADRGRGGRAALQPRGERANPVAEDRRLAEDRHMLRQQTPRAA